MVQIKLGDKILEATDGVDIEIDAERIRIKPSAHYPNVTYFPGALGGALAPPPGWLPSLTGGSANATASSLMTEQNKVIPFDQIKAAVQSRALGRDV